MKNYVALTNIRKDQTKFCGNLSLQKEKSLENVIYSKVLWWKFNNK